MNTILLIENLTVEIDKKIILKEFNLEIKENEIHALMGPNGVGKSTLSKVIMNDPNYKVISGVIKYKGKIINDLSTDERANLGIFLAMQNPYEIEGVTNADFLKTAVSSKLGKNVGLYDFIKESEEYMEDLKISKDTFHRSVNEGFSGGEKKRNEILQMKMLKPSFIILDELDSGLDVDSIKIVTDNINKYIREKNASAIIITHYLKLLKYIKPDVVNVIIDGKIVKKGDYKLAEKIENEGYEFLKKELKESKNNE